MKRLCKDIDITDRDLISRAVYECLDRKYKRNDTMRYMSQVTGIKEGYIRCIYHRYGKRAMYPITEIIITELREELLRGNISFPPIYYREKIDASSRKIRRIGIQNVKQQLYDYIAVDGLKPILKRVGEYQVASIKGRGALKGKNTISRWIRNRNMRYFVKLDIRKCFESIDHEKLYAFLNGRINNDRLMDLIRTLVDSFERGLSIGSYLSQHLCNLYMSVLYHYITEDLYKTRRGKRTNLVRHCLIYMDDILLIGTRAADLKKAARLIKVKAKELGMEIKPDYQIRQIDGTCIDMMGYRIYRTHTEIRKRIFLRARRAFRKARERPSRAIAKKCISYYGYIKHTDSRMIERKWKVRKVIRKCKGVIRNESKIYGTAAAG